MKSPHPDVAVRAKAIPRPQSVANAAKSSLVDVKLRSFEDFPLVTMDIFSQNSMVLGGNCD